MSLLATLIRVGLLVVFLTSSLSPLYARQKPVVVDKIAGMVGDQIILQSDIENTINDAKRQGQPVPDEAYCALLDQAVISKVLMLQAQKDSLVIAEEEVEALLDQKIRYFVKLLGGKEQLEQYAGKSIYQIKDDARESVREQKLAENMQYKILNRISISPAEVLTYFEKISDTELPLIESRFEIGQIVMYPQPSREMENYISAELNNFKRQIESGVASFEQLSTRFSEDMNTKVRGGFIQVNRNDNSWGSSFLSAAFRLKEGQISAPLKSEKGGFFLIKMERRIGDEAELRIILRIPPTTEADLLALQRRLDSIRLNITAGHLTFNEAAKKYTEDDGRFNGPYLQNSEGQFDLSIDQLDNETVGVLRNLKVGDISAPVTFTNEQGKKGVRLVYLKSRSEPHIMNLRDDYSKIANAALEEKKRKTLQSWLIDKMSSYYIMIDNDTQGTCPAMAQYASKDGKAAF